MKDQFVPYELSVKLKELGFNEECLCVYYTNTFTGDEGLKYKLIIGHGNIEFANDLLINTQKYTNSTVVNYYVTAPLWQQAFDWFRDQHSLHAEIRSYTAERFTFVIKLLKNTVNYIEYGGINSTFETYEEARQSCLEKLIQILEETK